MIAFAFYLAAAAQAQPSPPIVMTPWPPPITIAPPAPPPPPPRLGGRPAVPRQPLASLFTEDDYPIAAIDAREQGTVGVVVGVSSLGRVTDCAVVESSGSASLDSTTCQIIRRRARFTPANDSAGHPTAAHFRQRVTWDLVAPPFAPMERRAVVITGPTGALRSCLGSLDCTDAEFAIDHFWRALAGGPMPPTSELVLYRRFDPGESVLSRRAGSATDGRPLFDQRVRIDVGYNGKVTHCVSLPGGTGSSKRLCDLVRSWIFELGTGRDEIRTGVWSVSLRARQPNSR